MSLAIVILAAGQGKRMHSQMPKVLHLLAGKPILEHIISTAQTLNPEKIFVVHGHESKQVIDRLKHFPVEWVEQAQQLGTAHALSIVLPHIKTATRLLVLYGDNPLMSTDTLQSLITAVPDDALGLVTATLNDPTGLGRILRDKNEKITGIVEEKDASAEQKKINEIFSGTLIGPTDFFKQQMSNIKNNNAQKEYYLTDLLALAVLEKRSIKSVYATCEEEVQGVNDRVQLAKLERYYQKQQAEKLMLSGVTLLDPHRFDLRGKLSCGQDVVIDANVIIIGNVTIGSHCSIGPNVLLTNVHIGDHVEIKANCVIEDADIGKGCTLGPFARIRPGSRLAEDIHIGNFVEIKNSQLGSRSKAGHLAYIGDTTLGQDVTIGAGTITCNYDGVKKHRTIIEDNVFIGSDTQLIAPVKVGSNATIGAGSTITKDVPPDMLTLSRVKQVSVEGWQRRKKEEEN